MRCTAQAIENETNTAHVGNRLGRRMLNNDWSVTEVAQRLGLSRQGLYNIILCESYPRPEIEEKIEKLLRTGL